MKLSRYNRQPTEMQTHCNRALPKEYLGVNLSYGARFPSLLDLRIVPVATLLWIIWVVVDHNDHTRLQLVPLVHSTGPRTNIPSQQLNHSVLWVAVMVNTKSV